MIVQQTTVLGYLQLEHFLDKHLVVFGPLWVLLMQAVHPYEAVCLVG